jgi:hypothetical protein
MFPGGELEGRRPAALCPACREALRRGSRVGSAPRRTLCFECYRAQLSRERALRAAGQLDTGSVERFQGVLPFEPVNRPRLAMLKAERAFAHRSASAGAGRFADRRRRAQIAARHALQSIAAGLRPGACGSREDGDAGLARRDTVGASAEARGGGDPRAGRSGRWVGTDAWTMAVHAAELQFPESWLPFVVEG